MPPTVAARLAAFAAVLVLVFGVTLAVGSASHVKPKRAAKAAHGTGMSAMAEGGHGAAEAPRGLGIAAGRPAPGRRHHHLPARRDPAVHASASSTPAARPSATSTSSTPGACT